MEVCAACLAGFASHRIIYIFGEWHLQATNLLKFYSLAYVFIALLEVELRHVSWMWGILSSSLICGAYALCLWGSMIVHRLYLHPLREFPGPRAASISKLWHVAQCLDSKNHLVMEKLYAQYGSFVRTGTGPP